MKHRILHQYLVLASVFLSCSNAENFKNNFNKCLELTKLSDQLARFYKIESLVTCNVSNSDSLCIYFTETIYRDSAFLVEFSESQVFNFYNKGLYSDSYSVSYTDSLKGDAYFSSSLSTEQVVSRQSSLTDDYFRIRNHLFKSFKSEEFSGLSVILENIHLVNPDFATLETDNIWSVLEKSTNNTEESDYYLVVWLLSFKVGQDSGLIRRDKQREELFSNSFKR